MTLRLPQTPLPPLEPGHPLRIAALVCAAFSQSSVNPGQQSRLTPKYNQVALIGGSEYRLEGRLVTPNPHPASCPLFLSSPHRRPVELASAIEAKGPPLAAHPEAAEQPTGGGRDQYGFQRLLLHKFLEGPFHFTEFTFPLFIVFGGSVA